MYVHGRIYDAIGVSNRKIEQYYSRRRESQEEPTRQSTHYDARPNNIDDREKYDTGVRKQKVTGRSLLDT